MVIQHNEVQLLFALFVMHGGDEHTAGIDAHHRSGGQVGDGEKGLADQLFGLIIGMNTGENHPICARSIVQDELQELLGLLHGLALLDLHSTEVGLAKGFKVYVVREQRLDLHLGEVDFLFNYGDGRSGLGGKFCLSLLLIGLLLFQVCGLHCRNY